MTERMNEKKKAIDKKLRSSLKKGLKYAEMASHKRQEFLKQETESSESSF